MYISTVFTSNNQGAENWWYSTGNHQKLIRPGESHKQCCTKLKIQGHPIDHPWHMAGWPFLALGDTYPESKVHWANMGPIWGRQDPGGLHVGPMNFAIWVHYMVKNIKAQISLVYCLLRIIKALSSRYGDSHDGDDLWAILSPLPPDENP